ncbi:secreted nis1 [Trichoderma arundinaceum]|uniref:Secreted nis1 n=1 Tax=Trichoderma arundinaceum TaxID=490622 RepID=A0A395NUA1_TRIAR|nr:secreted nis1 [Trichoderma arundinaceum]
MRFSIAAAAPLLSAANALISGIAVPETVAPGDTIQATITTQNYIQAVYDVAIVFGFAPGDGFPGSLGSVLGSFYLGPHESNIVTNITKTITIPDGIAKGDGIITASVMSLWGAAAGPALNTFNVTITVGDVTSKTYKSSHQ